MPYTIGIDFGSLSARALLVDAQNGEEIAVASMDYPHAVMDRCLPDGSPLPPDFALQHPKDYMDCLIHTIRDVMQRSEIKAEEVVGIGLDVTACTLLPVDRAGEPLCYQPCFASEPHAYVKLWKHHAAQPYADRMNRIAEERQETFLYRYGNKLSSEWLFPKLWETLDKAPHVYNAAHRFVEAADWLVWQLTGQETRGACAAGYKALWSRKDGFPSSDFFASLDPRLTNVIDEKLGRDILPLGEKAGTLTKKAADLLGLREGIAVAAANVDAHVSLPAAGITQTGDLLMIMGTSICHVLLSKEERLVPGICGVVEDGVLPGLFGYEAGQPCVGDLLGWFTKNMAPADYAEEAKARGLDLHQLLTEKAARLQPGESGLLALDWWNGNRSVLVDADLSGLLLGLTLRTKPEDIYRALIEATAFGTRIILEGFEDAGIPIHRLFACGGLPAKNPFLMQVFSDVTGREIRIARSKETPALGSALHAATAAGLYASIYRAADAMGGTLPKVFIPDPDHHRQYEPLYQEYKALHEYFGREGSRVMKRLKGKV